MTNSYRRQPFAAYCGGSQQKDKRIGNRRMRRVNRVLVYQDHDAVFRTVDEMMNPYDWSQDGTRRYQPFSPLNARGGHRHNRTIEEAYRVWYVWAKAK